MAEPISIKCPKCDQTFKIMVRRVGELEAENARLRFRLAQLEKAEESDFGSKIRDFFNGKRRY